MESLGTAPGDTLQGDRHTNEIQKMRLNLERTADKRRRTAKKKVITLEKGRRFFQEKIGVTPSVAAPGDTNPSDATE